MTNFEKVKELVTIDNFGNFEFCKAIKKLRNEKDCFNIACQECKRWLTQEYDESILDDAERKYLSAVIKPFRNRTKYIKKCVEVNMMNLYILILIQDILCYPSLKQIQCIKIWSLTRNTY